MLATLAMMISTSMLGHPVPITCTTLPANVLGDAITWKDPRAEPSIELSKQVCAWLRPLGSPDALAMLPPDQAMDLGRAMEVVIHETEHVEGYARECVAQRRAMRDVTKVFPRFLSGDTLASALQGARDLHLALPSNYRCASPVYQPAASVQQLRHG